MSEQLKAIKNGKAHRWHPEVIQWCLRLFLTSHSKYEELRQAGFLVLPSPRTLQRHSSRIEVAQGICKSRMQQIAADTADFSDPQRVMMLVFDEMHVSVSDSCQHDSSSCHCPVVSRPVPDLDCKPVPISVRQPAHHSDMCPGTTHVLLVDVLLFGAFSLRPSTSNEGSHLLCRVTLHGTCAPTRLWGFAT